MLFTVSHISKSLKITVLKERVSYQDLPLEDPKAEAVLTLSQGPGQTEGPPRDHQKGARGVQNVQSREDKVLNSDSSQLKKIIC